MQVTVETLRMRINRLKHLIAGIPAHANVPEEIKHTIETAPQVLQDAESALQLNDPLVLEPI